MNKKDYICIGETITVSAILLLIVSCSGFIKETESAYDRNHIEKAYVDIIVDNNYDYYEKETTQTLGYCGPGGMVSCGKGAENKFINDKGPFTKITKEVYSYINDELTGNEGKHRTKKLTFHFLKLSNNSNFNYTEFNRDIETIENGVFVLSGKFFQYGILAKYNNDGYCHLVKDMATRFGADNTIFLNILYSEDVSEKYLVNDWYAPDGMSEEQKSILNEFKRSSEKAFRLKWKP